jgi:signal transduction histidine kinase
VNDILDFAQLEENKIVLNMDQLVNLEAIITESIELLRFKADLKGLSLNMKIHHGLSGTFLTDGNRLK